MQPLNLVQHASSTTVFCVAAATLVPVLITFCFVAARPRFVDWVADCVVALRDVTDFAGVAVVPERAETAVLAVLAAAPVIVVDGVARGVVGRVAPYASNPKTKNDNINNKFFIYIP